MPIWRWVQMPIQAEHAAQAEAALLAQAPHTRAFPGCLALRLYREEGPEGPTFYSLSAWESLEALEKYRNSALFRAFWAKLKPLFREAAQAHTLTEIGSF